MCESLLGSQFATLLFAQSQTGDSLMSLLRHDEFLVFGFLTLIIIVPSLAHYWHITRARELEASLKHEMLQRGFSADEIVQVLSAGTKKAPASCRGSESADAGKMSQESAAT